MHSDWFNGIEILQGRWQHGEKGGYCYHSGLEKTRKWDMYVPLVTNGLIKQHIVKTCRGGGLAVWRHAFLTSAQNGLEWSVTFLDFFASLDSWNCDYCGEKRNLCPCQESNQLPPSFNS